MERGGGYLISTALKDVRRMLKGSSEKGIWLDRLGGILSGDEGG